MQNLILVHFFTSVHRPWYIQILNDDFQYDNLMVWQLGMWYELCNSYLTFMWQKTICNLLNKFRALYRVNLKSHSTIIRHHPCNTWRNWDRELKSFEWSEVKWKDFWEPPKFLRDHFEKAQGRRRFREKVRDFWITLYVAYFAAHIFLFKHTKYRKIAVSGGAVKMCFRITGCLFKQVQYITSRQSGWKLGQKLNKDQAPSWNQ